MDKENRPAKIMEWRESLAKLPDNHFFDLMRVYLGEIKTPYNKQRLIEELGVFLAKPEVRKTIFSLLSEDDLELLCAIVHLQNPTRDTLSLFLKDSFSYGVLYEHLLNLEERLLIYRQQKNGKTHLALNPHLEKELLPLIPLKLILPPALDSSTDRPQKAPCILSPLLLASLISFVNFEPDLYKADGSMKKKAQARFEQVFGGEGKKNTEAGVIKILVALKNLQLIKQEQDLLSIDIERWKIFAQQSEGAQQIYLTVASLGRFTRETARNYAQLFIQVLEAIPAEGFTKQTLLRCFLLLQQKNKSAEPIRKGRFAAMLAQKTSNAEPASPIADTILDFNAAIDALVQFGLLNTDGAVYTSNIEEQSFLPALHTENVGINIDGGFGITILPGFTLSQLIPLVQFLNIEKFDTASRFEITRKSCTLFFDKGGTPDKIVTLLETLSHHSLSQNLLFSIEDWYKNYNSASLFKGFVLSVAPERQIRIENNEVLVPFIRQVLAPGIYLLSFENDDEAQTIIKKSGLDFIGAVKTFTPQRETVAWPPLLPPQHTDKSPKNCQKPQGLNNETKDEANQIRQTLLETLEKKDFAKEQQEELQSRIMRNIIVHPSQLRPESVRIEKLEASGMDFLGKVRIVEHALASESLLYVRYDDPEQIFFGKPLAIEKQTHDALIKIQLEGESDTAMLSISRASLVKRLKTSIFREIEQ